MLLQQDEDLKPIKISKESPRIIFYTTFGELFGEFCHAWRVTLEQYGFAVEVMILKNHWQIQLPVVANSTVNIFVAGLSLLKIIGEHGLPEKGKKVLWVVEPLTDDESSEKHYHKSLSLKLVGHCFDVFIGMDDKIVSYLREKYPNIPSYWIPYTLAPEAITLPVEDDERSIDVLWLARLERSSHRSFAYQCFQEMHFPVRLISAGLYGEERDQTLVQSKISLEVHGDHVIYCNQFRLFMSWAKGSVVLSEQCDHYADFGIKDGVHLVISKLEEFSDICKELLSDPHKRMAISHAAQELLRQQFTTKVWVNKFIGILHSL